MAKQSGLGGAFYLGTSDISGDIQSAQISGGIGVFDVTDITQSAHSRIGGLRNGTMNVVSFFDTALAHPVLSALPTTDVITTYCVGTTIGQPAASMNGLQLNYDGTRAADGMFTFKVDAQSDGYGLEWGVLLTAGMRTDTTATDGTSWDTGGSLSFGGQAYLHVTAFSGTDVTIKIQDSADNSSFSDVTSFTFGAVTATTAARVAISNSATIRRYVRVSTTTSAGFTSVTFAVVMVKNAVAGQVF